MTTIPQIPTHRQRLRLEALIGRFAALCAHPCVAWRIGSRRDRLDILIAYAAAAYAIVLCALLML